MNPEMRGLKAIIGKVEMQHGIEPPPEREDFDTYGQYVDAHDAWWIRVHCWQAEKREAD